MFAKAIKIGDNPNTAQKSFFPLSPKATIAHYTLFLSSTFLATNHKPSNMRLIIP